MSNELIIANKEDLVNIADAIREKAGTTDAMALEAMAEAIAAIESGGVIIETGTIIYTDDDYSYQTPIELASKGYSWPDIAILYKKPTTSIDGISETTGLICGILTNKIQNNYEPVGFGNISYDSYTVHYNNGVRTIYAPYVSLGKSRYYPNTTTTFRFNWSEINMMGVIHDGTIFGFIYIWGAIL